LLGITGRLGSTTGSQSTQHVNQSLITKLLFSFRLIKVGAQEQRTQQHISSTVIAIMGHEEMVGGV
jgi:hypothetical protein